MVEKKIDLDNKTDLMSNCEVGTYRGVINNNVWDIFFRHSVERNSFFIESRLFCNSFFLIT